MASTSGAMEKRHRIGIDVGGTFTDLVIAARDGTLALHKVPTTPLDVAQGLLAALESSGVAASDIGEISHGTTVATNALLERKGARTGLLTTEGFRDLLELRDGGRRSSRGRQAPFEPLIPRQWRWEAPERLDAAGAVLTPLHEEAVRAIAEACRAERLEALAVAFLHAEQNDRHERRAQGLLAQAAPELPVVLGSEVCPFPDERLRMATAALAAYLAPLMSRYVDALQRMLDEVGAQAAFRFIESAGGSSRPDEIRRHPLRTILSGPAGGAMAGGALARLLNVPAAVTTDMGGTSFDVAILRDGRPELTGDRALEFGLTVSVPSVDIHTAGIGGGSLVQPDESIPGAIQVGPESAGAFPGPACFGRGGRRPTVTDANLLLGRLVGARSDLGLPPLDLAAAEQAMLAEICPTLGLDPIGAARVVLEVAEGRMAAFITAQLAARGVRPGQAALIAFGGAGPVEAGSIGRRLGLQRVVVPYLASGFSALGCLLSPPARTAMLALEETLESLTPERLRAVIAAAVPDAGGAALRVALGLRRGENRKEDLLPLEDPAEPVQARVRRYHAVTVASYGTRPAARTVRVTRLLVRREEPSSTPELSALLRATFGRAQERWAAAGGSERAAGPNGTPQVPVEAMAVGAVAKGPALVVLPGATAFVPGGTPYHVDEWGNLILESNA